MAELTYFTVIGSYSAAAGDGPYDAGDPRLVPMTGVITITPLVTSGDTIEAATLSPPTNLYLAPIKVNVKQGRIQVNGEDGVRLVANTSVLNLDGDLFYRVEFREGLVARGTTYPLKSFTFQAPSIDTTVDLVTVTPVAGSTVIENIGGAVSSVAGRYGNVLVYVDDLQGRGTLGTALVKSNDQAAAWNALGVAPSANLPSYVDDVLEFPNQGNFPTPGETGKIYVALDTNDSFRWTGSTYIRISDRVTASGITDATTFTRNFLTTVGDATAARSLTGAERQATFNVKDFLAKGDGTTDDSTAIAAAISAATAEGGTVYFPPGTYIVGSSVALASNVTLQGSAAILKMAASLSGAALLYDSTTVSNVVIDGLTFDTVTNGSSKSAVSLSQSGTNHVRITNCTFINAPSASTFQPHATLSGVQNISIDRCRFLGDSADNTNTQRGVLVQNGASRVAITNSYFEGYIYPILAADTGAVNHNLIVANNRFYNTGMAAVCILNCNGAAVANNTFDGSFYTPTGGFTGATNGRGIVNVQGANAYKISIVGNTSLNGAGQISVYLGAHDVTITGNTIYDCPVAGVEINSSVSRITVSSNTIVNAGAGGTSTAFAGIFALGLDISIIGNMIRGSQGDGIVIGSDGSAVVRAVISGNICTNNSRTVLTGWYGGITIGGYSVAFGSGSQFTVSDNLCTDDQGTKTQQYGFIVLGTGITNAVQLANNNFQNNKTAEVFNQSVAPITTLTTSPTIRDSADATKQVKLDASGIPTGTTRTLTLPNATDTLVARNTTEAIKNKTFDSSNTFPTFNQSTTGNAGTATKLATARNIDGQLFDGSADVTVIAPGTHAATSKTTPVAADEIPLVDSAAANALKKLTWANLTAAVAAASGGVTTATANSLAQRDSNANLFANTFVPSKTSTATAGGTTTLTVASAQVQVFTGSSSQTVLLPTTGVTAGQQYTVNNMSSANISVQSSAAALVTSLAPNRMMTFTAKIDTPTAATDWTITSTTTFIGSTNNCVPMRDGFANLASNAFIPSLVSTATAAGTTTLTVASAEIQVFTGTTTQTCVLPTTTIVAGQRYTIINTSTGSVTVNASGGSTVTTLAAGTGVRLVALQATPTASTHWFTI